MCEFCDANSKGEILSGKPVRTFEWQKTAGYRPPKDKIDFLEMFILKNEDDKKAGLMVDSGYGYRWVDIDYCPFCRKEVRRVKQILDYSLELENVKENELPEKDNEKIIQFNNTLSEKYGLFEVDVLENDNLYFRGRITSNTKSENNAKLKLLIAELNEFYKKYNLKKVIKSMIAYGHTI